MATEYSNQQARPMPPGAAGIVGGLAQRPEEINMFPVVIGSIQKSLEYLGDRLTVLENKLEPMLRPQEENEKTMEQPPRPRTQMVQVLNEYDIQIQRMAMGVGHILRRLDL